MLDVLAGLPGRAVGALEEHELASFVARTLTAREAVDLLASEAPPLALLITQDGKKTQSDLRILVSPNVPALLNAWGR